MYIKVSKNKFFLKICIVPSAFMIKLRGHHLICLHFFKGEGYNSEFVKNLKNILKRIEDGEKVEVHSGADDVCKMCPYLKGELCFYNKDADIEIKKMDIMATELLRVKNLDKIIWEDIKKKIPELFSQWSKKYCRECAWRWACEKKSEFTHLYKKTYKNTSNNLNSS